MSLADWFRTARGLVALVHEVRRLADACERIADKLEGRPRGVEGDAGFDILTANDSELHDIYELERKFRAGSEEHPPARR